MIQLSEESRARCLAEAMRIVGLGDLPGHEFHGNQYTGGLASYSVDPTVPRMQREKIHKALDFVEREHPEYLSKVHIFVAPTGKGNTSNPHGYTKRNIKIENGKPVRDAQGNIVHSGKYTVYISSKQKSTEDFVRTIAHELEHVAQWERGEDPHESGAMAAGNKASHKFRGLGGPGSGNFGHAGRPGEVGGSAPESSGVALTPEQQFEQDKKDYLTPGEFAKLPPGILKWKIATRKAAAEAKKAGGEKKVEVKPEVKPPVETKQPGGPTINEREKAIGERADELRKSENLPWHEAHEKARQEDATTHGPMPTNTLHERQKQIGERTSEIRQANPGMDWEKAHKQAKIEDAQKHGPWLQPDQVAERAALLESDQHWSVAKAVEQSLPPDKPIPAKPEIAASERTVKQQLAQQQVDKIAAQLGHDPNLIVVRDYSGRKFELNGQTLSEAGHYAPQTGLIEINAKYSEGLNGTIVHEIQHAQWDFVKSQADRESLALNARWRREQEPDFTGPRYFLKNGKVVSKYRDEVEAQVPHMSLLARAGLGSRELGIKPDTEGLLKDDGVSDYSKMYWTRVQQESKPSRNKERVDYFHEHAVNETLSEIQRRRVTPGSRYGDEKYPIAPRFSKLNESVQRMYAANPVNVRRHFATKYRAS